MKSTTRYALTAAALAQVCAAVELNTADAASIKAAAKTVAEGLWSYHRAPPATSVAGFVQPEIWEWWESGNAWTGLMDYGYYTGDNESYGGPIEYWLNNQLGAKFDFTPTGTTTYEANDDQAYWLYNALTAMEYGFPVMGSNPAWNVVAENVFAEFVSRWNLDKATCNGGLKWQYTESNSGYYYKNTVSNGAMFQTAARLARFYQGENTTYTEWANTVWDWTVGVGFISADYNVYDGAGDDGSANCTAIDEDQWTYNLGTYLHGAAHMFNVTDDSVWETRVQGLLATAKSVFFDNGVLYEQKCEPTASCSYDNVIFKASLARWMAKTAVLVPSVKDEIMSLLATSASGAAQACVGLGNSTCGVSWTKGGYDGSSYFGNELSALETIQSLLVFNAPRLAVASSKNTT